MSRLMAAVVRKSDPMPPSPPWLETAAANSADVAAPLGAQRNGTSMPRTSQRRGFRIPDIPSSHGPAGDLCPAHHAAERAGVVDGEMLADAVAPAGDRALRHADEGGRAGG